MTFSAVRVIVRVWLQGAPVSIAALYIHSFSPAKSMHCSRPLRSRMESSSWETLTPRECLAIRATLPTLSAKPSMLSWRLLLKFPDMPTLSRTSRDNTYAAVLDGAFNADPEVSLLLLGVIDDLDSDYSPSCSTSFLPLSLPQYLTGSSLLTSWEPWSTNTWNLTEFPFKIQLLLKSWMPLPCLLRHHSSLLSKQAHRRNFPNWDPQLRSITKAKIEAGVRRDTPRYRVLLRRFKSCLRAKKKKCQRELCMDHNPDNAWTITKTLSNRHRKGAHSPTLAPCIASTQAAAVILTANYHPSAMIPPWWMLP